MSFEHLTEDDYVITYSGHIAKGFKIAERNGVKLLQGTVIGAPGTVYAKLNIGLVEWEIDGRKMGSWRPRGEPLDLKEKINFDQGINDDA